MSRIDIRPKVTFVLAASVMGGVQKVIEVCTQSPRLAEKFDFSVVPMADAERQSADGVRRIFIFQDASSWRGLPGLARFRYRCGRSKLLIHEHHYSESFERCVIPSRLRFRTMLRLSYALADRVIAVAQSQAVWMTRNRLAPARTIEVIRSSSDVQPLYSVSPREDSASPRLVAYGRFASQKGFDVLLAAMRLLPRGKVRLVIAGSGPDETKLRALAEGLDDVSFDGIRTDLPAFLGECDAVVIPSRWEPWGLVCAEAKAAARPVIVSRVDGLTEQVSGCGLMVPPEDPNALAAALMEFAALPSETRRAWGEIGRDSVRGAKVDSEDAWDRLLTGLSC